MSFPECLRRELIQTLRGHPLFADVRRLRKFIHESLSGLPDGRVLASRLHLSSSPSANAMAVVAHTRERGRGSQNALGRILERALEVGLSELQSLAFCAVFEALAYYGSRGCAPRPRRWGAIPPPPRRFVAVSSAPEDNAQVAPLVTGLRNRGFLVEWTSECPKDVDWLLWVTGRFSGADQVILACSPIYSDRYRNVLTTPFSLPPELYQLAQEFRLMAYEYFVRGPGRLLPVLLQGADQDRHIPVMARYQRPCYVGQGVRSLARRLGPTSARVNSPARHSFG
ncbi:MAG: hypothetical protein KTR25_01580 [Myxococcales bacterium]|nr:hypothetical protein [Myxococcales bacterium]